MLPEIRITDFQNLQWFYFGKRKGRFPLYQPPVSPPATKGTSQLHFSNVILVVEDSNE